MENDRCFFVDIDSNGTVDFIVHNRPGRLGMEDDMKDRQAGDYTSVSIPNHLFNKIEQRAEETGFDSALDYILFVLTEVVIQPEEQAQPFTEEEEEQVMQHLHDLGYL